MVTLKSYLVLFVLFLLPCYRDPKVQILGAMGYSCGFYEGVFSVTKAKGTKDTDVRLAHGDQKVGKRCIKESLKI